MADDRLPKKPLFCRAEGTRRPGHSRKGWRVVVQSDLEHFYTCCWYAYCQSSTPYRQLLRAVHTTRERQVFDA